MNMMRFPFRLFEYKGTTNLRLDLLNPQPSTSMKLVNTQWEQSQSPSHSWRMTFHLLMVMVDGWLFQVRVELIARGPSKIQIHLLYGLLLSLILTQMIGFAVLLLASSLTQPSKDGTYSTAHVN